jgi:hypothetical protein
VINFSFVHLNFVDSRRGNEINVLIDTLFGEKIFKPPAVELVALVRRKLGAAHFQTFLNLSVVTAVKEEPQPHFWDLLIFKMIPKSKKLP